MSEETEAPAAERSSGMMVGLLLVSLAGMAGGVFVYQQKLAKQAESGMTEERPAAPVPIDAPLPVASLPPAGNPSGLYQSQNASASGNAAVLGAATAPGQPGAPGTATAPAGAGGKAGAAQEFTKEVRANEKRYESLAMRYTRKYPIIRKYGRDWMSHADLKRYNDEYFQDHDPIKFAKNVAASPNFAKIVKQYAGRPEMIGFVKDAAQTAPAELMKSIRDYMATDNNAAALLKKFSNAMGLPEFLLAGIIGNKPVDPGKAAASMINSNPQLKGLLEQQHIDPAKMNTGMQAPKDPARVSDR